MYPNTAKTKLVCDITDTKCEVASSTTFSVDIVTNPPPTGGFILYRIVLRPKIGVNLVRQVGFTGNRVPKCNLDAEQKPPPAASAISRQRPRVSSPPIDPAPWYAGESKLLMRRCYLRI